MRYRGDRPGLRKELETLGFSADKIGFDTRHWDHIYEALVIYKDLNDNINVPRGW